MTWGAVEGWRPGRLYVLLRDGDMIVAGAEWDCMLFRKWGANVQKQTGSLKWVKGQVWPTYLPT